MNVEPGAFRDAVRTAVKRHPLAHLRAGLDQPRLQVPQDPRPTPRLTLATGWLYLPKPKR